MAKKCQNGKNKQNSSIDGYNAKKASLIKNVEIIRGSAGVQKYPTNQKTREDEEEIDAAPCNARGRKKKSKWRVRLELSGCAEVMVDNDHPDGDAAESVEFGDPICFHIPFILNRNGTWCYALATTLLPVTTERISCHGNEAKPTVGSEMGAARSFPFFGEAEISDFGIGS
jgi:hypothetical protein